VQLGLTAFHLVRGSETPFIMPDQQRQNKTLSSLPVKLIRVLIVKAHEVGKERLLEYGLYQKAKVVQHLNAHHREIRVRPINSDTPVHTLRALIDDERLRLDCIPTLYGGGLRLDDAFDGWVRSRLSVEDIMSSAMPVSNTLHLPTSRGGWILDGGDDDDDDDGTDTRNNTVRRRRRLLETGNHTSVVVVANGWTSPLDDTGTMTMTTTTRRYEGPLVQRRPEETQEEFIKRRNICYGQRMVQRWRQGMTDLDQQRQSLQHQNDALRRDNRRLEEALVRARYLAALYLNTEETLSPPRPPAML